MSSTSKNICWRRAIRRGLRYCRSQTSRVISELRTYRSTGRWGERVALRYLKKSGTTILGRNWKAKRLEADIIVKDGRTIALVEVKTRHVRLKKHHPGISAITHEKFRNLNSLAKRYMRNHGPLRRRYGIKSFRIDVMEVYYEPSRVWGRRIHSLRWRTGLTEPPRG